jgi:hypothetical protein
MHRDPGWPPPRHETNGFEAPRPPQSRGLKVHTSLHCRVSLKQTGSLPPPLPSPPCTHPSSALGQPPHGCLRGRGGGLVRVAVTPTVIQWVWPHRPHPACSCCCTCSACPTSTNIILSKRKSTLRAPFMLPWHALLPPACPPACLHRCTCIGKLGQAALLAAMLKTALPCIPLAWLGGLLGRLCRPPCTVASEAGFPTRP